MLVEFRVQKYGCLRDEQVPSVAPLREERSAAEAISLFSRSRERLWQKLAHALATPDLPEGKACTLEQKICLPRLWK